MQEMAIVNILGQEMMIVNSLVRGMAAVSILARGTIAVSILVAAGEDTVTRRRAAQALPRKG